MIFDLAYEFLVVNDSLKFREWNKYSLQIADDLNIPSKEAIAYWDLAGFQYSHDILDSAYVNYYSAYKIYKSIGDESYAGRMLLGMAILQENVKDNIGSETTTIAALELLDSEQNKASVYSAYNNLGIVSNGLGNYSKALEYHTKAENLAQELDNKELLARTLNNVGVVYKNKKDYQKSIKSYSQALEIDSLFQKHPKLYAMVLDNYAYAKLKMHDNEDFYANSARALKIRDSIGHEVGIAVNKLHLGEYFLNLGDTIKAKENFKDANKISRSINNYKYLLESLLFLARTNKVNDTNLKEYIKLNDSLLTEERRVRNKFARIRYETDQYIEESKILGQQKSNLIIAFVTVAIILLLLYFYTDQKSKNRTLKFEQEQQKSNEQIYNLLLNQQLKLEEGRQLERTRIAEELHDGILGKLFGTRINLSFMDKDIKTEQKESFEKYIDSLQGIEKEIRAISHDLAKEFQQSNLSFIQIIEELLLNYEGVNNLKLNLKYDKNIEWENFSNERLINVYRIIQEAIQNVVKHANATHIDLKFDERENGMLVKLSDNGHGFKKGKKIKGIGLKNMYNRAEKINSDIDVSSSSEGVVIEFMVFNH